jgi:hypothetical protein
MYLPQAFVYTALYCFPLSVFPGTNVYELFVSLKLKWQVFSLYFPELLEYSAAGKFCV